MGYPTLATVQVAMELVDSKSEDEQSDDLVAALAGKLVRKDRNRIPLYCEEVIGKYFKLKSSGCSGCHARPSMILQTATKPLFFFPDCMEGAHE